MLVMGTSLLNWKPRELDAKLGEVGNSKPFIIKGLIAKKA